MTVKLDIEHMQDMIDYAILKQNCSSLDFLNSWLDLIEACIRGPTCAVSTCAVLVNGSPLRFFFY